MDARSAEERLVYLEGRAMAAETILLMLVSIALPSEEAKAMSRDKASALLESTYGRVGTTDEGHRALQIAMEWAAAILGSTHAGSTMPQADPTPRR